MAISTDNDRRSITLPRKLWGDLEAEVEQVKGNSGQKVTVSELIQRAIEDAWSAGEPEEQVWVRRMDQLSRDVEQLRGEVTKEFQEMHMHITCWIEEMKQGWPSGALTGETPVEVLRAHYRAAAGGDAADPFAPPREPAPEPKRWRLWRRS